MAARSGGRISHVTVGDIINRGRTNFETETLIALAEGLGVSPEEVFAAYRQRSIGEDLLDLRGLFDGWNEATEEDRAAALDDLRMIAERFQRRRRQKPPSSGGNGKKK